MEKELLYRIIEETAPQITDLSDRIWSYAELSMLEHRSTAAYVEVLKAEGFTVQENLCGIATAFSGSFGSGRPVIGLLGEFDALSGLSQAPGLDHPQPLEAGGCGHGCGHNPLPLPSNGPLPQDCSTARWYSTAAPVRRAAPERPSWPETGCSGIWMPL